jgi:hypothetical protein
MNPKGYSKAKLDATNLNVPEVKEDEVNPTAAKKHFLDVEVIPPREQSPLNIYDANPMYCYRWCQKDMMGAGRRGIWHTVPKDHPDFKELRVQVDHSLGQNYYSYKDVILCCARKETVAQKRKRLDEKIQMRDAKLKTVEENVIKATKENLPQGIRTLENAIGEQSDLINA